MNFRVDVIIIGDSTTGHEILDKIASTNPAINIAFISHEFKSTTTHDYRNVKYFKNKVEYVSYRHKLFCCYTNNGDNLFSTHLIVASGLNYEPLVINGEQVPNVFNTLDEVPKLAKDQPALVVCNKDADAKLALDVAKKYKQVYLCTPAVDISEQVSNTIVKKLAKVENIAILPNTCVHKTVVNKDGMLQKVELNNYSEINCSAIYTKTASTPAIDYIPRKILPRDDGYPSVKENCESALVPGFFAAGSCLKKYTKAMEQKLIETILSAF